MSYQTDMNNQSAYNNACAIHRDMLSPYMSAMMDASPRATKKRAAHAYAAEVRARNPSMQVKKVTEAA